jgi:ABC-type arginine/histidine transport system permease subunit
MVVGFWLTVFAVVLGVPLIMALALARRSERTAAVAVVRY